MTPDQCRAARALLGVSAAALATRIGVSEKTIQAFESGRKNPAGASMLRIRAALVVEGIRFINDATGVGVLRRHEISRIQEIEREEQAAGVSLEVGSCSPSPDEPPFEGPRRSTVGRLLEEALTALGWTQKELARTMGWSPAYVSAVITGKRNLTLSQAKLFAGPLGMDGETLDAIYSLERSLERKLKVALPLSAEIERERAELDQFIARARVRRRTRPL
jgi:transcriptional regulator with XRE-family HTH domain